MTFEELMDSTPPVQQHALVKGYQAGFAAGAASWDAEVAGLNQRIDLLSEANLNITKERDQLREQVKMLSAWIKQQGEITDTCTFHLLREVCENCACHRNKALAATEPTSIPTDT